MAERRMFAKTIIESDAFLDMSSDAKALYFFLGIQADDDGFVNKPNSIRRMVGVSEEALQELIDNHFLIEFETGVVVIKHWMINNAIRKDRYTPTKYTEEKAKLRVKENGAYTMATTGIPTDSQVATSGIPSDNQPATTGIPTDNQRLPQVSIGKDSIDKGSIGAMSSSLSIMPSRQELMRFLIDERLYVSVDPILEHFEDGWPQDWKTEVRKFADNYSPGRTKALV